MWCGKSIKIDLILNFLYTGPQCNYEALKLSQIATNNQQQKYKTNWDGMEDDNEIMKH